MSISNAYEAIMLATLSNGDWKQWWRGTNDGGLHPELLTNSFFETDASGWTLSNDGGTYAPSWDGNDIGFTQGYIKFKTNWSSISQTVTGLTVGETYSVNMHFHMYSIGTSKFYIDIIDGSDTYRSEIISYDDFASGDNDVLGIVFEAQNTSVTVKIRGYGSGSNPYVWRVSMRKNDRWLGLHTQTVGEGTGTFGEVSGNGYKRIPITFGINELIGGYFGNDMARLFSSAPVEFPEATGSWGTITYLAVYSRASAATYSSGNDLEDNRPENNHLFAIALDSSKTVDAGDIVRFERASIELDATNA